MFPIGDDAPSGKYTPWMFYLIIGANILMFMNQMSATQGFEDFIIQYGLIPGELFRQGEYLTLLTSMFMHGSLMHIGGNMLFLYIFGNNVESHIGPWRFLVFYLMAGFAGDALSIAFGPNSMIPSIGASGAIAGILGYYMRVWPHNRIRMIGGRGDGTMAASGFLGYWIVLQIVSGVGSLGQGDVGGVGRWAHIGGFVWGYVIGMIAGKPAEKPTQHSEYHPFG